MTAYISSTVYCVCRIGGAYLTQTTNESMWKANREWKREKEKEKRKNHSHRSGFNNISNWPRNIAHTIPSRYICDSNACNTKSLVFVTSYWCCCLSNGWLSTRFAFGWMCACIACSCMLRKHSMQETMKRSKGLHRSLNTQFWFSSVWIVLLCGTVSTVALHSLRCS